MGRAITYKRTDRLDRGTGQMSQKIDQSVEKNPKAKKTISLEAHVDERLTKVCSYLGCSIHSYLIAKVGEAVSRDFVQFQLGNNIDSQQELMKLITGMLQVGENPKDS